MSEKDPTKSSWTEWSQHVLNELERLNSTIIDSGEKLRSIENNQSKLSGTLGGGARCQEHGDKLDQVNEKIVKLSSEIKIEAKQRVENKVSIEKENEKISEVKTDIATLKVKSGIWGAAGAAVPIIIGLIIWIISELYKNTNP